MNFPQIIMLSVLFWCAVVIVCEMWRTYTIKIEEVIVFIDKRRCEVKIQKVNECVWEVSRIYYDGKTETEFLEIVEKTTAVELAKKIEME